MQVVPLRVTLLQSHTIESWRARVAVGDERVVHRGVLAAPLGGIGTRTLGVLGIIETLANDAPLDGGIVCVVGCQTLFHRPRHRTMVNDDVLTVFHVQSCEALVGLVAGTEAHIADNDVVLVDIQRIACYADAAARRRLSEDAHVRVIHLQLRRQEDGSRRVKQNSSRRVVACPQGPAQRARHQLVVCAVVIAGHVIHLAATSAGSILAIAVSGRESQRLVLCRRGHHRRHQH